MSPLLFIQYTNSCKTTVDRSFLIKFADDTALLSLLYEHEHVHSGALPAFLRWCDEHFLDLNVSKTKEMIFDFRLNRPVVVNSTIHGDAIEIGNTYKYLGTTFDDKLKLDVNTDMILRRSQQRLYLLRKLRSFSVSPVILTRFYQSFIESLITFSFTSWFHNLSVGNRNSLVSLVKISSKITGTKQRDLAILTKQQILSTASRILTIPGHVLASEFSLLWSGRRYAVPVSQTNRY